MQIGTSLQILAGHGERGHCARRGFVEPRVAAGRELARCKKRVRCLGVREYVATFCHTAPLETLARARAEKRTPVLAAENYEEAAVRHYSDAEQLAKVGRYDGAGHLMGFAAECAIKHALSVLRPAESAPHRHLPDLVESAKKVLQGVHSRRLLELFQMPDYFVGWTVSGRYYADGAVTEPQYQQWRSHTQRTLAAARLRGSIR